MTKQVTITETGCYLDNHRGHYLTRDMIELAAGYGYIIGPFERWTLDGYEDHNHEEDYPHEALTELADDALEWLNSGQDECDDCGGTGIGPKSGEYWTHADDTDRIKRCKRCTGTGQAPRIAGQNFPPRVPEGHSWQWFDGDFGLYLDDPCEACGESRGKQGDDDFCAACLAAMKAKREGE